MGQQWRLPLLLTAGLLCAGLYLLLASPVATGRSFTAARSLLRGANVSAGGGKFGRQLRRCRQPPGAGLDRMHASPLRPAYRRCAGF